MKAIPDFAQFLHQFVSSVLGFSIPMGLWSSADWTGQSGENVEKASADFKNRIFPEMLQWETRAARTSVIEREEAYTFKAGALLEAALAVTIDDIKERYQIDKPIYNLIPSKQDFIHIKINHGYWEQLFMIFHDGFVDAIMRPTARGQYRDQYALSRFNEAMVALTRYNSEISSADLSFPGVDLGFSFGNGGWWHSEWLQFQKSSTDLHMKIARGVYAGSQLFQSNFGSGLKPQFVDGAFAKRGLLDGSVAALLSELAVQSDSIVFCVPPHLERLRLKTERPQSQDVIHLSRRFVHQSWPMTLAGVGSPILSRLARGETTTVIVQAAVFSALLGLYLKMAKAELGLPGRLLYVDLGQALDAASPEGGGEWARKHANGATSAGTRDIPFEIAATVK